jgi:hypothetical protein
MKDIITTINESKQNLDKALSKDIARKIASDLSQLDNLNVQYYEYVKKLFDDVFTEIEKLQKKHYNIDTNQFIWDMKDYFDAKNKSTHE